MDNLILDKKIFKCKLEVLTGLHIGGYVGTYGIGGVDSPVIKNPIDNTPIIPGSSLKGKMRFLLDANSKDADLINKAFGYKETNNKNVNHFSRFIFRDLLLTEESKTLLQKKLGQGTFTEIKAENSIDYSNGKALSPRFIERVPRGAIFSGEIVIQRLTDDDMDELVNLLKDGVSLLEESYLGGNGTRGYGQVKITLE